MKHKRSLSPQRRETIFAEIFRLKKKDGIPGPGKYEKHENSRSPSPFAHRPSEKQNGWLYRMDRNLDGELGNKIFVPGPGE